MKIYCIADNMELEIGLKLAGCEGITLDKKEDIEKKIDEVVKINDIGLLIVSRKIYERAKEKIEYLRHHNKLPLITII